MSNALKWVRQVSENLDALRNLISEFRDDPLTSKDKTRFAKVAEWRVNSVELTAAYSAIALEIEDDIPTDKQNSELAKIDREALQFLTEIMNEIRLAPNQ